MNLNDKRKGVNKPNGDLSSSSVFSPVLTRNCENSAVSHSALPSKPTPPLQSRNYSSIISSVFSPLNTTDDSPYVAKPISHSNNDLNESSITKRKHSENLQPISISSTNLKSSDNYLFNQQSKLSASHGKDLGRNGCPFSDERTAICNGSKNVPSAHSKNVKDASIQTEGMKCSCSSSIPSSSAVIQGDFMRSIIEASLEEFSDRNRYDFQTFYSQFVKQIQIQEEKTDAVLKNLSTIDILTKENERLRKENEKLKLLRFGK